MRLTDAVSVDTGLELESTRALPAGSVEISYRIRPDGSGPAAHDSEWAPSSQRR
jgi:hypothetical protein